MKKDIVVIGAGMGGLTAALRLAREGFHVQVLEARLEAGGLASGNVYEGFSFDAGPYILLDRPGLEWAWRAGPTVGPTPRRPSTESDEIA